MLDDSELSKLFLRKGIADDATLQSATVIAAREQRSLYDVLLRERLVEEERAVVVVSKQLNLACVSLKDFEANPRILELVPFDVAQLHQLMPLGLTDEGGTRKLFVAMANPLDIDANEEITRLAGFPVVPLLAGPNDVATAIGRAYAQREPSADAKADPDDGLSMLDGLLEESVSRLMAPEAEDELVVELDEPKLLTPAAPVQAAPVDDKLKGFSLDFSDLSLSSPQPRSADVHNKMTLPARVEVPKEILPPNDGAAAEARPRLSFGEPRIAAEPRPEPRLPNEPRPAGEPRLSSEPRLAVVATTSTELKPSSKAATPSEPSKASKTDSAPGMSLGMGDDWDLSDLDDDVPQSSPSASRPPVGPRNETSGIRYVADPSLQSRAERDGFLGGASSAEIVRALVQVLVRKGLISEEQLREEIRRSRQRGNR